MYPRIEIDLEKLRYNAERLLSLCGAKGIEVSLVTKVLAGNREIVGQLASLGFAHIADSRLENLEAFKDINIPKMLLRLPMPSKADRVARLADISLNSEIATIRALDKAAGKLNVKHKIVLMFDLGDLREGVFLRGQLFRHDPGDPRSRKHRVGGHRHEPHLLRRGDSRPRQTGRAYRHQGKDRGRIPGQARDRLRRELLFPLSS